MVKVISFKYSIPLIISTMGDAETSEIVRFLKKNSVEAVNIALKEELEPITGNLGQIARYELKYSALDGSFSQSSYLHLVQPEQMGGGHPVDDHFNLEKLADSQLKARLPRSQQVLLMRKALDQIAEIDPRIRGEEAEPVTRIVMVGSTRYNPEFMKAFYVYIAKEESKL